MEYQKSKEELSRRRFLQKSAAFAIGTPIIIDSIGDSDYLTQTDLTCRDISDHFRSTDAGKNVNWEITTDTLKSGDPSKPVKKVAVAWKASWDALREAVSNDADLFISHESICVNAKNGSPDPEVVFALPSEKPKFDWLEKTGLVVYRCHDVASEYSCSISGTPKNILAVLSLV
jgi:hypothetical protein